uniref:Protein QUIRKY n=1 Tax=Nicotiana tabacum TaxID=4097 RepID=A0A1S3XC40_TOBAC
MSNLKLGVEVVGAHNLLSKDGKGSSSPFVELHFDGQKFRTTIKEKDLDPYWNETFYFNISDPNDLTSLTFEALVYSNNKSSNSKSSLGKVKINGSSFVPYSDAVLGFLSRARGELSLKVFITDDPSVRVSNVFPAVDSSTHISSLSSLSDEPTQQIPDLTPEPVANGRKGSRRTFHHLPNSKHQQQEPYSSFADSRQPTRFGADQMKSTSQGPKLVRMYSGSSSQPVEYSLKETSPFLGGGRIVGGRVIRGGRPSSTYDLVEPMQFLFVRVVKARDLPSKDLTGSLDPYVEVRVGNYKGVTQHFEKNQDPEWNTVFAFAKERMQSSVLDVVVKDKDMIKDDFVGIVRVDLHEVPTRV